MKERLSCQDCGKFLGFASKTVRTGNVTYKFSSKTTFLCEPCVMKTLVKLPPSFPRFRGNMFTDEYINRQQK